MEGVSGNRESRGREKRRSWEVWIRGLRGREGGRREEVEGIGVEESRGRGLGAGFVGGRDRRFERSRGAGAEGSVARRSEVIGAWMARGIGGAGSRGSREAGSKEVGLEGDEGSQVRGS